MPVLKRKLVEPGRYDVVRLWDGKEEPVGKVQRFGGPGGIWRWNLNPDIGYFGMSLGQKPYGTCRTLRDVMDELKGLVI